MLIQVIFQYLIIVMKSINSIDAEMSLLNDPSQVISESTEMSLFNDHSQLMSGSTDPSAITETPVASKDND